MDINELVKKYNLSQNDCWELKQKKGTWILSHDACEKIASIEKIELIDIQVLNSERDFVRLIIKMKSPLKSIMSIGEADNKNCFNSYFGCMAEKRGIDRCILKIIDAYQYSVYSEVESNDFNNTQNQQKQSMAVSNFNNGKVINHNLDMLKKEMIELINVKQVNDDIMNTYHLIKDDTWTQDLLLTWIGNLKNCPNKTIENGIINVNDVPF
jgi:hypothetical protein